MQEPLTPFVYPEAPRNPALCGRQRRGW